MPWLDNVTVTKTGPAEDGTMYVALRPADGAFHRWFKLEPAVEKEMLATALTAVAGAKTVQCYLTSTDSYATVRRMYVRV